MAILDDVENIPKNGAVIVSPFVPRVSLSLSLSLPRLSHAPPWSENAFVENMPLLLFFVKDIYLSIVK